MNEKLNRYRFTIVGKFLLLSAIFASCTHKFDEINTPKNLLSEDKINSATVGQAFGYVQYYGLGALYVQTQEYLHAYIYAQYFTSNGANYPTERYVANGSWVNSFWREFYSKGALMQLTTERVTEENAMPVANAIAKIWRVEIYHRMTDYFGPIAYSQFGNYKTSVPFDSQQDIYNNFFTTLDEAVAVLKSNPSGYAFGNNDQVYRGATAQWLKFANSLRLRLAMRIVYADAAKAKAEAEKAVADGVITSNGDNAGVASTANNINILSRITYLTDDFLASSGLMSALKGYNDPRLSIYYAPAINGGQYAAARNGLPPSDRGSSIVPLTSSVGSKWVGNPPRAGTLNPSIILNAAEVAFLRAEGALRGWNMGGTAEDFYNEGIRLSLTENVPTITPEQIISYQNGTATPAALADKWNSPAMSDIPVLYDANGQFEKQLEQIITQKWLALFPNGYEAWAERRRTGYPRGYALIGSDNPTLSRTDLARRVIYPPSEVTTNANAYNDAVGLLGGPDGIETRLWWDKKPLSDYPVPTN